MAFYPSYKQQFNLLNERQKKILNEISHLEEIDGWLLLSEATELFGLASQIKSTDPIVCEIGVWKGKSSYIFASALRKKNNGTLYSIDPFDGKGDTASKNSYREEMKSINTTLLENFENTMIKYRLRKYIKIIPMLSEKARLKFPEPRIDLLFIDGDHKYESVKKDYELWSHLIPSGGKIVLHDVEAAHVDGPKRVMQEYIANSPIWKNPQIVGEMGIATKI